MLTATRVLMMSVHEGNIVPIIWVKKDYKKSGRIIWGFFFLFLKLLFVVLSICHPRKSP